MIHDHEPQSQMQGSTPFTLNKTQTVRVHAAEAPGVQRASNHTLITTLKDSGVTLASLPRSP